MRIKKEKDHYLDTKTNETMKMFAFCFNPKTKEVYAYGSNAACKLVQKDKFLTEHMFFPIM